MNNMKQLKIKNEVFGFEVIRLLWDKEEVRHYLISNWLTTSQLDIAWGYTVLEQNKAYLYLDDKSDYILLHECIHIIQGLFHRIGIETGYWNTEVLAYNTDWLYRKLLLSYYKYKKNDKYKNYL